MKIIGRLEGELRKSKPLKKNSKDIKNFGDEKYLLKDIFQTVI